MEANDPGTPLLERLKFLGIYQSNLEEFFMVRVGILTHRAQMLPDQKDPCTGWAPSEQIRRVLDTVRVQQGIAERIWRSLLDTFAANGIDVLDFRHISKVDELMCKKIFSGIRPLLFPRVISGNTPIPFLWGKESYIIAWLGQGGGTDIAIVPMTNIPSYTAFEINGRQKIVLTDQLVLHFLPLLFKKSNIQEATVVRLTRNADVFLSDKLTDQNFRMEMSAMLKKRKRQLPVRLQIFGGKLSPGARNHLTKSLRISQQNVFYTNMPFDMDFRSGVKSQPGFKYDERRSSRGVGLKKGEYFSYIEKNDLLLALPFQNMMPFVDLLYEAADDPEVESIRITLYRLAGNSKVAAALAYAADRGKHVLALLELRARFDEQNNIDYSEMLEDAGCTVIYGLPDQKVHCKLCLITRRGNAGVRHITQIGTGNYNEVTGEQYCDLSLMTASEAAAADAEAVFSALAAGNLPPAAKALWVAPLSFKQPLMALLDREIAKGERGRVIIKVNSVNHREIMRKLIDCSKAGVHVELYVRGICCLRPGVKGQTENISVRSIVGRWLEHARIYCFGEGEDERMFIGSGDLLNRNVERRVEVFTEATTPETKAQLRAILDAERADRSKGWLMQPNGSYILDPGEEDTSSQEALYRYFHGRTVTRPLPPPPPEPKPEPVPELKPVPEPKPEPKPKPKPVPEPKPEAVSETGSEQKPGPVPAAPATPAKTGSRKKKDNRRLFSRVFRKP